MKATTIEGELTYMLGWFRSDWIYEVHDLMYRSMPEDARATISDVTATN